MAPKRKSDAVAVEDGKKETASKTASRSSTRGKAAAAAAPASSETKKPASKTDTKKAAEEAPASKKAKTESSSTVKKVGEQIDDVELQNDEGQEVSLSSLWNKSGIVLFSYPKASTPGCTTQACNYRDIYKEFEKVGWQVWGISTDTAKAQAKFKEKHTFGYDLLCDPQKKLLKQIGWTEAKKRNHWVIGKGGELLEAALGVKPADDAKNALEFVKSVKK